MNIVQTCNILRSNPKLIDSDVMSWLHISVLGIQAHANDGNDGLDLICKDNDTVIKFIVDHIESSSQSCIREVESYFNEIGIRC